MNIKEFAEEIGVSPAAVSQVVNGSGRISKPTREMVLLKMQELGYVPNVNAKRLVTGKSYMITLHPAGEETLDDAFMLQLMRVILRQLRHRGYDLMLNLPTGDVDENELLRHRVQTRQVDGTIIFGRTSKVTESLGEIASADHPCVVIGQFPVERVSYVGSVVVGLRTGVRDVARLLVQNGHRQIGFIDEGAQDDVLTIFAEELETLGVALAYSNVVIMGPEIEHGAEGLRRLMDKPLAPTAVFARTDTLALGALQEAKYRGLRVPQDLSIVGHDDLPIAALLDPALTSVRVDCDGLGAAATDLLFDLLDHPDRKLAPKIVDTALIVRDTVGPAPASTRPFDPKT